MTFKAPAEPLRSEARPRASSSVFRSTSSTSARSWRAAATGWSPQVPGLARGERLDSYRRPQASWVLLESSWEQCRALGTEEWRHPGTFGAERSSKSLSPVRADTPWLRAEPDASGAPPLLVLADRGLMPGCRWSEKFCRGASRGAHVKLCLPRDLLAPVRATWRGKSPHSGGKEPPSLAGSPWFASPVAHSQPGASREGPDHRGEALRHLCPLLFALQTRARPGLDLPWLCQPSCRLGEEVCHGCFGLEEPRLGL